MPRHPPIALKTLDHSHCQCSSGSLQTTLTEKTSFSRSVRWPAVKPPIIMEGIERSPPTHPHHMIKPKKPKPFSSHAGAMSEQIFSSQCQTEQAASEPAANLFFFNRITVTPHFTRQAAEAGVGGAGRDRTDDPLLAKQVLSQLSYSPFNASCEAENGGPG